MRSRRVQVGAVVADRFRVESAARSGGMGTVYRAHDLVTGQPVALKVVPGAGELTEGG